MRCFLCDYQWYNRSSPLIFGGISVGTAWHEYTPPSDKEKSFKLLDTFVEAGGVHIDTASGYSVSCPLSWLALTWAPENSTGWIGVVRMVRTMRMVCWFLMNRMNKVKNGSEIGWKREEIETDWSFQPNTLPSRSFVWAWIYTYQYRIIWTWIYVTLLHC